MGRSILHAPPFVFNREVGVTCNLQVKCDTVIVSLPPSQGGFVTEYQADTTPATVSFLQRSFRVPVVSSNRTVRQ